MSDQAARRAREYFEAGYYCAEAVLLAIAEHQGIESDLIPRIATGLTAGFAHTGRLCGALAGGTMGIGLIRGRRSPADSVDPAFEATQKLLTAFEAQFGATSCADLTGVDLNTPEGQAAFRANQQGKRCADYVEEAARLALRNS